MEEGVGSGEMLVRMSVYLCIFTTFSKQRYFSPFFITLTLWFFAHGSESYGAIIEFEFPGLNRSLTLCNNTI